MPFITSNSANVKAVPSRYLGAKAIITAPLFEDEAIDPVSSGLLSCTYQDCRDFRGGADCYENLVFGSFLYPDSELLNDKSSFLLFYPFTTTSEFTNSSLSTWYLQKYSLTSGWQNSSIITGSTYGTYYDFQSLAIDGYKGFVVDWGLVLRTFGEGFYRIKVNSTIYGTTTCIASYPYHLLEYSCERAHGTTKFEANITGKIGRRSGVIDSNTVDLSSQNTLTDLTGIDWYMSIRVPGFFGREKTEYEKIDIEYENGEVNTVRDEAIQKYEWISGRLPQYVHNNFKIYFLMADSLKVSDYNKNNGDYFINQRKITKDSNYEPEYKTNSRLSRVTVSFKDKFQNIIKVNC